MIDGTPFYQPEICRQVDSFGSSQSACGRVHLWWGEYVCPECKAARAVARARDDIAVAKMEAEAARLAAEAAEIRQTARRIDRGAPSAAAPRSRHDEATVLICQLSEKLGRMPRSALEIREYHPEVSIGTAHRALERLRA